MNGDDSDGRSCLVASVCFSHARRPYLTTGPRSLFYAHDSRRRLTASSSLIYRELILNTHNAQHPHPPLLPASDLLFSASTATYLALGFERGHTSQHGGALPPRWLPLILLCVARGSCYFFLPLVLFQCCVVHIPFGIGYMGGSNTRELESS